MNRLKPVIQSPVNGDMPTCEYLLAWLKGQCQQRGARVLVIDPITMMQTPVQGFKDHERFVAESKNIMAKYGASLIVVTHPKRGMPGTPILPCLENLPNSSAYERFCDTILWLEWIEESSDEFVALLAPATSTHKTYNRVLHTLKVRLDVNPKKIGYVFDANTLRHVECGKFVE
jgi:hypothetical protein